MGNVCDDGGWLHSAAPQAGYDDRDAGLDDDNDSVAGEASDVNNLSRVSLLYAWFVRKSDSVTQSDIITHHWLIIHYYSWF
jgi:hypothetical protein